MCCAVLRQNVNQFEYDCLATDVVKFLLSNQTLIFLPIKTDLILSEKFSFFDNDDNNFYKVSMIHFVKTYNKKKYFYLYIINHIPPVTSLIISVENQ